MAEREQLRAAAGARGRCPSRTSKTSSLARSSGRRRSARACSRMRPTSAASLRQLRIGGEPAAELDLPPRRACGRRRRARCPSCAASLRRLVELARDARPPRRAARSRARGGISREALGHLLRLLPEPRLGDLRPRADVARAPSRGRPASSPSSSASRSRSASSSPRLRSSSSLALELPEVEQVAARQEPFLAEQREQLLADEQRAEAGLRLVELRLARAGARAADGRGRRRAARGSERGRGRRPSSAPRQRGSSLKSRQKTSSSSAREVRHERAARLDDRRERRRVGDQRREGAPVVGVALDPAVLARAGSRTVRADGRRAASSSRAIRAAPSISCSICGDLLAQRLDAVERPAAAPRLRRGSCRPCRGCSRILVCASTAARRPQLARVPGAERVVAQLARLVEEDAHLVLVAAAAARGSWSRTSVALRRVAPEDVLEEGEVLVARPRRGRRGRRARGARRSPARSGGRRRRRSSGRSSRRRSVTARSTSPGHGRAPPPRRAPRRAAASASVVRAVARARLEELQEAEVLAHVVDHEAEEEAVVERQQLVVLGQLVRRRRRA